MTVTDVMAESVVKATSIRAGVVQVDPLDEVAYNGPLPPATATNRPDELTATDLISLNEAYPFTAAGVVNPNGT